MNIQSPTSETPPRFLAIITARGGSKNLPHKNVLQLAGRPMIAYTIEAALRCPLVGRCIVTTDDPEIKAIAVAEGAEVLDRPAALATDHASSEDAVAHVLDWLDSHNELPTYFTLLQPTSPLRNAKHLADCLSQFLTSDFACVISVCAVDHHPYKSFTLTNGQLQPLGRIDQLSVPRQSLPEAFRQNGAIYAMRSETFCAGHTFFSAPAMPYVMREEDSIDVDTRLDFEMAERMLAARCNT